MSLQTEVKNHVIIFIDKSKQYITEVQANAIMERSSNIQFKNIQIDESLINFSSISKILTLEDFYQQYPEEKPSAEKVGEVKGSFFKDFDKQNYSGQGKSSMLRGYERAMLELHGNDWINKMTQKETVLYNKFNKTI